VIAKENIIFSNKVMNKNINQAMSPSSGTDQKKGGSVPKHLFTKYQQLNVPKQARKLEEKK